jgi:hypothetical protein
LSATVTGAYTDGYLTDGAKPDQAALNPTLGLTGDAIPNVPKFQGSLFLKYRRPIGNGWEGMVATNVTYRDEVEAYFSANGKNTFNIPLSSYTLVGLQLGVINGPWSVTAFARNLTDERAEVSAINSTQDPHGLLTVRPRTIGLTLTRTF